MRFTCSTLVAALAHLMLWSATAHAHPTEPCRLELAIHAAEIGGTLHLPADDLGLALAVEWGQPTLADLLRHPDWLDAAFAARLGEYVGDRVALADAAGQAFDLTLGAPRWTTERGAPFVVVPLRFTADGPRDLDALSLSASAVIDEVVTQKMLVLVRADFARGQLGAAPEVVARLRRGTHETRIDRADSSPWRGMLVMFRAGAHHIVEGLDHLLFVLVLLLVAPLRMTPKGDGPRRWRESRSVRATVRRLLVLISAFTVGHCATLALSALGVVDAPVTLVEVIVGVSIALGALHAIRPVFGEREGLIAAAFGLVHGLAFSEVLRDLGLRGGELVASLAAFSVGIEVVQVGLILLFAPLLALAARQPGYGALRGALAIATLVAAGAWIVERVAGTSNPVSAWLEVIAGRPLLLGGVLVSVLVAWNVVVRVAPRLDRSARGVALDAVGRGA